MMLRHGLNRQILMLVSTVTIVAGLVVFFGSYIAFSLLWDYFPTFDDSSWFSGTDFIIFTVLILLCLLVGGVASLRLARRILEPLNSLAQSARRIKDGDLSARALPGDRSLGETALLVEDFNAMAKRLQDMAADMALWNATIAHELRTPLTILKGRIQGIIDGVFEPDEASLQGLIFQIDSLARLVEDLRVVTLADSGHLDLQMEEVQLAPHIESLAGMLDHDLREEGFILKLNLTELTVRADAMRIRQVLLALISNARRYAGSGTIEISLFKEASRAVIRVADEGPGLAAELSEHVFDPFRRGDPSRSREFGGNGLGLSVVRAIAEAHGGSVRYRQGTRRGASFDILLDLDKPA